MKIILFRHGLAMEREDAIAKKMEDSLRPLVAKGKERTRKMAKLLMDENVDLIASSPFVRAMETAEILHSVFRTEEIKECVELVPAAPPQAFAQWLKSQAKTKRCVLAVGHEPQLSVFASWALAGDANQSFIELKKSGAICLTFESFEDVTAKSARLNWVLSPKLIL